MDNRHILYLAHKYDSLFKYNHETLTKYPLGYIIKRVNNNEVYNAMDWTK